MSEKSEAMRLADEFDGMTINEFYEALGDEAAAELRRLVAEHEEDQRVIAVWRGRTQRAEAQRDALLEALKLARSIIGHPDDAHSQMIDAAIRAAEEQK